MGCSSCGKGVSLPRKAVNFSIAMTKETAAILSGVPDLMPHQFLPRLAICNQPCEHLQMGECLLCGCPVHRKIKFRSSKCDDGKW